MSNNEIANLLLMVLLVMIFILIGLICVWVYLKFKTKRDSQKIANPQNTEERKSKIQENYDVKSIFDFMEFDKIEDNMIVQKNGKRFIMIIQCQGINYDLMSGVEKSSVEQGFIQYLNTLRFPIQIYVQTRSVDLTSSISTYKQKIKDLGTDLAQKEFAYNQKVRAGTYDRLTLGRENFEVVKARNLYEYGMDIVNNTEKMSLNKNILSKQYYIILSYYPEEANDSKYAEEEVANLAFSELYTRAQSSIGLLSVCGVNGKILDSYELADLLYFSYNRDEAEIYDLKKAINAGYDSPYVTAPDVLDKKMQELDKQIEREAIDMANEAIYKVRDRQEKERQLQEKERRYKDLITEVAASLVSENEDILGKEVTNEAIEEIQGTNEKNIKEDQGTNKKNIKGTNKRRKEEDTSEKKKVKRTGRPRKTA